MRHFVRRSRIDASADETYAWHERPGAFERLTPPWERVKVIERSGGIEDGARVLLEVAAGPLRLRWSVTHRGNVRGRQFEDIQTSGPLRRWKHTHRFAPDGAGGSFLEDEIEYALPFGLLSEPVFGPLVDRKLARTFIYRHTITRDDLRVHAQARGAPPLNILVSGATGLIGSALVPFLTTGGHRVVRLARSRGPVQDSRSPGGDAVSNDPAAFRMEDALRWDPAAGVMDEEGLEGFDAVVHLAAENIGEGVWTASRRKRILESRVRGTRLLCEALARRRRRPKVLVSSSAVGIYGDRGEEIVDEASPSGRGFLAEVCREWEAATRPAEEAGIRVVRLRTAVVLTPSGGALAKMLLPFRLGVGGALGSGRQYMSWIAIDDLVSLILHAITRDSVSGPLNASTPNPVTNREFARAMGRVLSRPAIFPVPARALRLLLGEMAQETLLSSARGMPRRAIESGYRFRHPELEGALRHLFGRMIAFRVAEPL
jgi:uncharacterized protein